MEKLPNKYNLSSMVMIVSEDGKVIANCMPLAVPKLALTFEEAAEHTEHLVKSANAYPKLVEALKAALPEMIEFNWNASIPKTGKVDLVIEKMQAALREAGELS